MRKPTPELVLYRWWRECVQEGVEDARPANEPQCGWYRIRMVAGGPWVPVEIAMHQEIEDGELVAPEVLTCTVGTMRVDPATVWERVRPISYEAWKALVAEHAKGGLYAATHAKVDLSREATKP